MGLFDFLNKDGNRNGIMRGASMGVRPSSQSSAGSSAADSGMDSEMMGYGLQLGGALLSQQQADQERKRQEEKDAADLALKIRTGRISREDALKQQEIENQMAKRGQNQRGLEYMTNLVEGSAASGRRSVPSFKDALLYGGR